MVRQRSNQRCIGTIAVPAIVEPFAVGEKFIVGASPVKIAWLDKNFKARLSGKIEAPIEGKVLYYGEPFRPLVEKIIVGLNEVAETLLAQIYALMAQQAKGEKGALLTDGYANTFYVRDAKGDWLAVDTEWEAGGRLGGRGWYLHAFPAESLDGWSAGSHRVFLPAIPFAL